MRADSAHPRVATAKLRSALDNDALVALTALSARYGLAEEQQGQLGRLLIELSDDKRAPSAVRSPVQAIDVHLADSLVALEVEAVRSAVKLVDVGAGAGFPGLPLAVALPLAQVRLVEGRRRKCAFMERVCVVAGIENARIFCLRAEEWREGIGEHDVALARALAAQAVVLEYAAPLLRIGGTLVDWRAERDANAERGVAAVARLVGLERVEIRQVAPFTGAHERNLHLYLKVRATPKRFPRRTGVARKRPLE